MAIQPIVTVLCMLSMMNGQVSYDPQMTDKPLRMADITTAISTYSEEEKIQLQNIIISIEDDKNEGKSISDIIDEIKYNQDIANSQPLTDKINTALLVQQVKANASTNAINDAIQKEQESIRKEEQSALEQIKNENGTPSSSQIDDLKAQQEKAYAEKQAYIQKQKDEFAKQQATRKIQTENDPNMDYSPYYIETSLDQEEYDMICAVVQAEAGGGTMEFREYVAGVIYNRIHSPYYPNTVYDVLHAPNQFTTISNYEQNYAPIDDTTRQAVSRVFDGIDLYILYNLQYASAYCNPYTSSTAGFAWFKKLNCVFEARYPANDPNTRWVHWFYTV